MQQSRKRLIAKEILILFSGLFIIALIWVCFWGINVFNSQSLIRTQNQIDAKNQKIDSLHSTFPKEDSFQDLITGEVPVEFLIEENEPSKEISIQDYNISELYKLLSALKFPFDRFNINSDFSTFREEILNELHKNSNNQIKLNSI